MQSDDTRRGLLEAAMDAPDDLVAVVNYLSMDGKLTRRTVSPVRYLTPHRMLVYCLGRCNLRSLHINRILDVRIRVASDVMAPEQIEQFKHAKSEASIQGDGCDGDD